MILIVRLLLPWSPDSPYSIYSLLSAGYKTTPFSQNQSIVLPGDKYVNKMKGTVNSQAVKEETASNYTTLQTTGGIQAEFNPKERQKNVSFSWYTIASYIWMAGIVVLGSVTYFTNRRLHRYIQHQPSITEERVIRIFEKCKESMGIQQHIPLVLAGKTESPTVFGFFRPKVLLSEIHMNQLNEQQLQHIFYHELAHIKRKDVGVNWLMHTLLLLNWFNPILWYAYSCMREDQELACDALALIFIDSNEQNAYGHTILSLLEYYPSYYQVPGIANLSRNKKMLKRRIFMIKKFQKKSYGWSILGIVTVMIISSLSLLNAHADGSNVKQEKQAETKGTVTAEVESNGFDPRMKKFIAEQAEIFKNTTDINEYTAKFDKLLSEFANQYTGYPTVEAAYDFENLRTLIRWGSVINFSSYQFQEEPGNEPDEVIAQAKLVPEYLKQLLNDLDVVINKNGKGETFGVLHQLDGEHVIELEKFTYGEQGFPAELKEYNIENYKIVEVESSRFDPRMEKFIAEKAKEFKNTTDSNEYSAKIEQFSQELGQYPYVLFSKYNTVDARYDFDNLRVLTTRGNHFIYVIGQQEQQGIDTAESIDELGYTFEYMKQLLNDLDVVMNKNGKGKTFGLSHQLDGEHVIEFEKFIWGETGRPEDNIVSLE